MSMRNERLKNSPAIVSPQKHNCIFSPTDGVVRKVSNNSSSSSQVQNTYSYPPFNAPLLVVSPTSPVGTPSRLPVVVPRQISKQVAPVINCTSWLNSEEAKSTTVEQHVFSAQPSLPRKEEDLQLLTTSQKPGFRGSKIPVRSARGSNNHGLVVYPTPCASRSKSLTNLTTDDFSSSSADFRYQQFDTSSQKSFQHRASPSLTGGTGSISSHRQNQATKPRPQGFPAPTSPSRPQLRQLSTSSSNLSLSSLQSPPSPSSVYRFSPRVVRRSCEEPLKASHEPYETPQYFTFHLTLRSPAKSPSRQISRPVSRCGNNNSFGSSHTKASLAATRCVEDMILQTCAVPSPEMLQSVRLPHSIHMPQVPSCEISIDSDSDYKGENDADSETVTTSRNPRNEEEEEEEEAEHKQRHMINEDSVNMNNKKDSSAGSNKSLSSQATTVPSPFELGSIEDIHCLSFGIVDYLNAVMKFQDPEKDETESNCSDCGSGLTISPPTRLSDNDSAIEPLPVSSDAPLKGNQSPRPSSSLPRNKPDIRNMKWRSSQELMTRPTKRRLLQRQLSDLALRSRLQERNLQGTSVQVYDGNIGVSVIKLPRNNRSSAPLRKPSRRCLSAMDEHLASHFSPQRSCDSPRADRRLVHEESGDSIEYGYHDSLIAEPSDTEYGEQMDIDENVDENTFPSTDSPPQVNSGSPDSLSKQSGTCNEKRNTSGGRFHGKTGQNFGTNMNSSITSKSVKEGVGLSSSSSSKLDLLAEPEIDRVLGILEDDGMGPGLSEDEMNAADSPPANCVHPSPRGVGAMISPHKIIWYLQESRRRSNESAIRRMQPLPVHHETASANAPKYIRAERDGSLRNVSVSDTSQPASAVRQTSRQQQVRQYSESSQYDSSAEESDTGAELSELERCVLSLTHRRSQLRKQDTNAYLIAPPEYKIGDDVSTVLEDS
ncbi:uncharacterized protein [Macrobrachium rosenbergii]|uniref:uncharacterized protein isoform X2 n=1 Tax=Macrobrachium rosenbergii TaxID=79674 RepID=UPI0034D47B73